MKHIKTERLKLIELQALDGSKKTGFPSEYINTVGNAFFLMSEKKFPGKICVYFEPVYVDNEDVDVYYDDSHFYTTYGDVVESDEKVVLTTQNSIYTFLKVDESKNRDDIIRAIGKSIIHKNIEAWKELAK